MIDEQTILKIERLRDDLARLKADIRKRYRKPSQQVTVDELRRRAGRLAETWLVEIVARIDLPATIPTDYSADLNVRFTRLLTQSQKAALRSSYETEINAILKGFTVQLVIPLKQSRSHTSLAARLSGLTSEGQHASISGRHGEFQPTAFVGHSFADGDKEVVAVVLDTLRAIGIAAFTGEKPKADRISEKVKGLIERQYLFVGVFTQRHAIAGTSLWATSAWVIDEKAYAVGKGKKLVLLREDGIDSIGGIQGGDYEYIKFTRSRLQELSVGLLEIFDLTIAGLRPV